MRTAWCWAAASLLTGGCAYEALPHEPLPASCRELLAEDPARGGQNGIYALFRSDGDVIVSRRVWCDMTTDGGGWTLVGRSAAGRHDGVAFGWRSRTGFVDDFAAPYALDATGLAFTEILVGDHGGGMTWATHAYRLAVPPDLLEAYRDSAAEVAEIVPVLGACSGDPPIQMLAWVGHTGRDDHFFLRDHPEVVNFGLFPGGFNLAYHDCRGGLLDWAQGMIAVR